MPKNQFVIKANTTNKFCELKNFTDTQADLYFYGDIVSDWWGAWQVEDQYPDNIKNFLELAQGRELNIYINSGGGSVFAGIAIYNILKRYSGKKHCFVDGLAGSIASLLPFVDSEKPTIPKDAFLMIHKAWTFCEGNSDDFRKAADMLESVEGGILAAYEENLAEGVSIDTIKELMAAETWLNGEQAAKYFNVNVAEEKNIAAMASDYVKTFCKNTPHAIADNTDDTNYSNETAGSDEAEIKKRVIDTVIAHM